jgi:DNA primase
MSIPPRFLDEIRSRLTLSDIIGKRVRLARAGREFKGCCPFHKEKSPSFYVNDDKQFYHCFGCHAHGDAIGFVMQHDNVSFIDAVEGLASLAGLQMPQPDPEYVKKAERSRDLHALMDKAALWMQDQLLQQKNAEVLAYLENRGLRRETLHNFRVGYAPSDRQALRAVLKADGFTDAQMIEAGLVKKSEKGGEPYVFFRDRVMFPVADRRGRVIAFGGRIVPENLRPPETGDYKPAKYINSTETPLFDKGRCLFAEGMARQAAREGKPIILMEGYMDVIASAQAGFTGAVAPMGTALTEDQIILMWAMIPADEKVPLLCFDGDNAGRNAAIRACQRILPLLKPNHSVRFAFLPDGEDPDSLIKASGAVALQKTLDASISMFDFLWLSATQGRNFATPEARAGLSKTLQDEIKKIGDRDVQMYYQSQMRAKISETFFPKREQTQDYKKGSFQKGSFPKNGARTPPRPAIPTPRPNASMFRDRIIQALVASVINHPHVFGSVEEGLAVLEIKAAGLSALRNALIAALTETPDLDAEALKAHLSASGYEKEVHDILSESLYVHAGFASPRAEPDSVSSRWLDVWNDLQKDMMQGEMKAGWRTAFEDGNQDEEDRLKTMAQTA